MRVISTTAHLLVAAELVSSEGVSMSEVIVMGLPAPFDLRDKGLLDLQDLIAETRRILVALGLDRVVEFALERGEAIV
jgi:hypothetical protein